MDNYKKLEYLEPQNDGTFKHIESGCPTNGNPLVEIPEGAEIAFYFGAEYNHIVFYKKVGKTVFVMSPNYLDWDETTYKEIDEVPYTYANSFIVWERNKQVEKDPALISGDVALANVHKCIVQYLHDDEPYGRWTTITDHFWSQYHLGMFLDPDTKFKFRFKPQTIKLELELPKPFEPEEDCHVYILDDGKTDGYRRYSYEVHGDKGNTFIGIWRTEEEVKQVVEQLRKIRGTNS